MGVVERFIPHKPHLVMFGTRISVNTAIRLHIGPFSSLIYHARCPSTCHHQNKVATEAFPKEVVYDCFAQRLSIYRDISTINHRTDSYTIIYPWIQTACLNV